MWEKVERKNDVKKKQTKAVYLILVSSNQANVCAEKRTRETQVR